MSFPAPPPTLTLLTAAHPPTTAASIHTSKLHRKPLYLHPTPSNPNPNARDSRRIARAAKPPSSTNPNRKPLTAAQKRSLGIHKLPRRLDYSTFLHLHDLWVSYMHEVLGPGCLGQGQARIGHKLVSADFHGAVLEVVRSRCVGRVGKRGVCVKETRGLFVLVERGGRVLEIPKEHTVFRFEVPLPGEKSTAAVAPITSAPATPAPAIIPATITPTTATPTTPAAATATPEASSSISTESIPAPTPPKPRCMIFEIHGQQFMYRGAERVGKKFKNHALADL